jgi:hypothetical protein
LDCFFQFNIRHEFGASLPAQPAVMQFENLEHRICLAPTALFIVSLGQRPRIWIALWL